LAEYRFVRATLVTDAASGALIVVSITQEYGEGTGEVSQFPALVADAERGTATIIGDGAYDTKECYEQARARGVRLICPPRINAVYGLDAGRDVTLAQIGTHGLGEWKRRARYHQRSLVEADIGAIKACLGAATKGHTFEGCRADALGKLSVMNLWKLGAGALEELYAGAAA
jgi:hypothetical protein